jgi:AmiR/NasT family two-component response regulator
VFTALSDPDVAQQSFAMGASAFVSKLASAHGLLPTIRRLCEDRRKDL